MKIFQKIQMASEEVNSYLETGVFYNGDNTAPIHDGALVRVGGLLDHDVYNGMKDLNARKLTAPTSTTDPLNGFVDYVGVSEAEVQGVLYRIGDKTAGLEAPAGTKVRVRMPKIGDRFWLGIDNFKSAPVVGNFAVPTANDTVMTVATTKATSGLCLEIEDTKKLITGQVNDSDMFYCRVVSL